MPVVLFDTSQLHPDDLTGTEVQELKFLGLVNNYPVGRSAVPNETMELYAHNDRILRVYVKTPCMNIVNLTGAVGVFTVKPDLSSTAVIVKHTNVPAEGMIGAADEGEMFFFVVPADTATLDIRQYVFDVKVTLVTGKVYTVLSGVINLLEPVG
jgi:hypothetical protein